MSINIKSFPQTDIILKKEGQTPLQALEEYRSAHNLGDIPMTYAGRLDPMAEGQLLILWGESCKQKDEFLGLAKEYEFDVLFGVRTDTYDILGLPTLAEETIGEIDEQILEQFKTNFVKTFTQTYPAYSSKPVDGKPLFAYARENVEVSMPTKEVTIYSLDLLATKKQSAQDVLQNTISRIARVDGDFRQEQILKQWNSVLEKRDQDFLIATFSARVSSGVYIRTLADQMGKLAGTSALAYRIVRTAIG